MSVCKKLRRRRSARLRAQARNLPGRIERKLAAETIRLLSVCDHLWARQVSAEGDQCFRCLKCQLIQLVGIDFAESRPQGYPRTVWVEGS